MLCAVACRVLFNRRNLQSTSRSVFAANRTQLREMSYNQLVEKQRAFWKTGATRCAEKKTEVLNTLKTLLTENKQALDDAIYKDLHRKSHEGDMAIAGVDNALQHLAEWSKPQKLETPPPFNPEEDDVFLVREPLGVVLVMAPWNFPLVTSMPLASALAAGNTVILKPSELAPTFSALIASLVKKHFDEKLFAVVEGGVPETTELLKERFDHIMYTGNPMVAKIVMAAAAKNLTPVTLELGGKNPVVVLPDADLDDAAQKIVFAKTYNCGQICLSADYVMTTAETKPLLVEAIAKVYDSMAPLKENEAFARIINERHFDRLNGVLSKSKGKVVYKAKEEADRANKFLPPQLIEIEKDDEMMKDEIFGPVLPILTVSGYEEAVEYIKDHEKPLGAYLFTKDGKKAHDFLQSTSSGGVSVNDVMKHAFLSNVPFGGVGNSGMGRINGKYGFDSFTHEKTILLRNGVGKTFKCKA